MRSTSRREFTQASLWVCTAFLLADAAPARSETLFENERNSTFSSGKIITYAIPADDFILDRPAVIRGATIQLTTGARDSSIWDGSGEWGIFSSTESGLPDELLQNGPSVNIERLPSSVKFDFDQSFEADTDTFYFLAFHA